MATTGSQAEWMMVGKGSKRRFETACHGPEAVTCCLSCCMQQQRPLALYPTHLQAPAAFPTLRELVFPCQIASAGSSAAEPCSTLSELLPDIFILPFPMQ